MTKGEALRRAGRAAHDEILTWTAYDEPQGDYFDVWDEAFLASLAANGYAIVPVETKAKHVKRGTTYDVLGEAHIQTDVPLSDMDRVVVYRCRATGDYWVRRLEEFRDGRFELVPNGASDED